MRMSASATVWVTSPSENPHDVLCADLARTDECGRDDPAALL